MSQMKLLVLADPSEPALKHLSKLPSQIHVQKISMNEEELQKENLEDVDLILNCTNGATGPVVRKIWPRMKGLKWMHSRWAGLDHFYFPELAESQNVVVTNGRGVFSSSLAEYTLLGCLYFAKDVSRMRQSQKEHKFDRFVVSELRGKTMGIIGYGDIGRACATLAKAFGMNVLAVRRRPELSENDPLVSRVYGNDGIPEVMQQSDYIVVAAALTPDTHHLVSAHHISLMKPSGVLVNVGRGPIVDEDALVSALADKKIKGAVLDVFNVEPLPAGHPIYDLDNVLMSAHCADMTDTFLDDATNFFVEQAHRYVNNEPLLHIVDKSKGY